MHISRGAAAQKQNHRLVPLRLGDHKGAQSPRSDPRTNEGESSAGSLRSSSSGAGEASAAPGSPPRPPTSRNPAPAAPTREAQQLGAVARGAQRVYQLAALRALPRAVHTLQHDESAAPARHRRASRLRPQRSRAARTSHWLQWAGAHGARRDWLRWAGLAGTSPAEAARLARRGLGRTASCGPEAGRALCRAGCCHGRGRPSLLLKFGAAASGPARRRLPDGGDLEGGRPGTGKRSVRLAAVVLGAVPGETASAAFSSRGPALWASWPRRPVPKYRHGGVRPQPRGLGRTPAFGPCQAGSRVSQNCLWNVLVCRGEIRRQPAAWP